MSSAVTKPESNRRKLLPGLSVKDGYTPHPFDEEFGVRTSGLVAGRHLVSGHKHDRYNTAYYGVAPSIFRRLLARWRCAPQPAALDAYSFIDCGAGMGRAILLASELQFRQVTGVELNPVLARIARQNISVWSQAGRARTNIELVEADVTEYAFPQGYCVLFLFNPFGAPVMRRLLKSIAQQFAERPGQLDLLYVNYEQEHLLEMTPGFVRHYLGKVQRSQPDAIADHKILANQPDSEYAAANHEDCSVWRWAGR